LENEKYFQKEISNINKSCRRKASIPIEGKQQTLLEYKSELCETKYSLGLS
jgi:hypothetical protein